MPPRRARDRAFVPGVVLAAAVLSAAALAAVAPAGVAPPASAGQGSAPAAAESAQERQVSEVASQLRCPVCQGVSVEDSPTPLAAEMRAVVREQLAAGRTPDQVKDYFVEKYGEWILLAPKPVGFNLVIYILPVAMLLAGGAFVALVARRWVAVGAADAGRHSGADREHVQAWVDDD